MMKKRWAKTIGTAAAIILGIAGTAHASTMSTLTTTGAKFSSINYTFQPKCITSSCGTSTSYNGVNYSGTLKDTKSDGHRVFLRAKVDGYGYSSKLYTGGTRYISRRVSSPAYDPVGSFKIQLCRDKGTLLPDNCTASPTVYRP